MPQRDIIDSMTGQIIGPEDAFELHRAIVEDYNNIKARSLALGEKLYWFEKQRLYKQLGTAEDGLPSYPSFNAYLADPEVGIKRSTAYLLKGIYKTFCFDRTVQQAGLLEAGAPKLQEIMPYIDDNTPESEVEEMVFQAGALSRSDLKLWLEERYPPPPDPPLPPGQYNCIYADPPWRYEFSETKSREIENHYPTMELDDICALPVATIAADDCVLFMWATSPKLEEAMQVINSWDFTYRTNMVWVKDKIGMGYYARQQHELLLIAVKGKPGVPMPGDRKSSAVEAPDLTPPSVVEAVRGQHSKKPHEFYDIIERMYPLATKVELFARNNRNGWGAWGNQL